MKAMHLPISYIQNSHTFLWPVLNDGIKHLY